MGVKHNVQERLVDFWCEDATVWMWIRRSSNSDWSARGKMDHTHLKMTKTCVKAQKKGGNHHHMPNEELFCENAFGKRRCYYCELWREREWPEHFAIDNVRHALALFFYSLLCERAFSFRPQFPGVLMRMCVCGGFPFTCYSRGRCEIAAWDESSREAKDTHGCHGGVVPKRAFFFHISFQPVPQRAVEWAVL